MDELEVNINYTDITMCEADGNYEDVVAIMDKEQTGPWMLRTTMSMDSVYGLANFVLHLDHDGSIRIMSYVSSAGNAFYNPDIQVLTMWADKKGWKTPQPDKELVRSDLEFWKHHWETMLLDSDLLDDMYGKRECTRINEDDDEDADDEH